MTAPSDPSDHFRAQAQQLTDGWNELLPALEQNPATYEPHIPGASLQAIGDIVSTIATWVSRVRAPAGTGPAFHLGRTLASASLSAAVNSLTSIRQGQYGNFPAFLAALLQVTNALHSQLVFAEPDEARLVAADATGQLAAAASELETTRAELTSALARLEAADAMVERLENAVKEAQQATEIASAAAQQATEASGKATEAAAATSEALGESEKDSESLSDLVKRATDLSTKLEELQVRLSESQALAAEQQKLIAALLPQGASAGLASAFAQRVKSLEVPKWAWASAFLVAAGYLGWHGLQLAPDALSLSTSTEVGAFLLKRIPTSGPLIWIAWFCAIQYGQTLRLQEDYAFKEATSKAFAGYRDHLEHLASVNLSEGNTAMTLLAARTIDVLSHEPLRIYGTADRDATPTTSLVDRLTRRDK